MFTADRREKRQYVIANVECEPEGRKTLNTFTNGDLVELWYYGAPREVPVSSRVAPRLKHAVLQPGQHPSHLPIMRVRLRPGLVQRHLPTQKRWLSADASPIITTHYPAPHSGNIRVLLLDRPQTRNALSRRLVTDLRRHIQHIRDENGVGGTRALIIASGNDNAFCAGADLKERKGMTQEE